MVDDSQPVVELVHERLTGRDVQVDDVVVGDAVEVLHQTAERVAVRGDERDPPRRRGRARSRRTSRAASGRSRRPGTPTSASGRAAGPRSGDPPTDPSRAAAAACGTRGGTRAASRRRTPRAPSPCSCPAGRRSGARSAATTVAPGSTTGRRPRNASSAVRIARFCSDVCTHLGQHPGLDEQLPAPHRLGLALRASGRRRPTR